MSLINAVADMIAASRNHNRLHCNASCQCYPLAVEIVGMVEQHHAEERNRLSAMLMDRTDELNRLKRLVGEEA